MINIRNIKGNYLLLKVFFWKSLGDLRALRIFHDYNKVCPRDLAFCDRSIIVKACRPCLKFCLEKLFSCLASVDVLVADEEYFHDLYFQFLKNINFAMRIGLLRNLAANAARVGIGSAFNHFLILSFKPRKGQPPELISRFLERASQIDANLKLRNNPLVGKYAP